MLHRFMTPGLTRPIILNNRASSATASGTGSIAIIIAPVSKEAENDGSNNQLIASSASISWKIIRAKAGNAIERANTSTTPSRAPMIASEYERGDRQRSPMSAAGFAGDLPAGLAGMPSQRSPSGRISPSARNDDAVRYPFDSTRVLLPTPARNSRVDPSPRKMLPTTMSPSS